LLGFDIYKREHVIQEYGVVKDMPTIESVRLQLEALEARYGIDTEEFVAQEGRIPSVDGEDGIDWLFLVEQLRVLKEAAVENLYSFNSKTAPLKNLPYSPDCLAA
jgi:hypothetical protein